MNLNATLFAQMIVFFILWWVVARFVWPPLVKALDERSAKVADGLAAAERGKMDLENATKNAELAMASARQEGVQRVAEAEKRAQMRRQKQRELLPKLKPMLSNRLVRQGMSCAIKLQVWPLKEQSKSCVVRLTPKHMQPYWTN